LVDDEFPEFIQKLFTLFEIIAPVDFIKSAAIVRAYIFGYIVVLDCQWLANANNEVDPLGLYNDIYSIFASASHAPGSPSGSFARCSGAHLRICDRSDDFRSLVSGRIEDVA
jgi:hypothetical protein